MGVVFYQYRAGTEWQGCESAPLWFLLKCHTRLTGWTIFKWFTYNYGRNATTITLNLTTSSSLQPSSTGGLIPLYPQVTRHYLPNTDLGNVQRCAVSPPAGPGRSVWVGIRTHLSGCGTDSGAPVHWFLVRACSAISSAERAPPWFLSSFEPVYQSTHSYRTAAIFTRWHVTGGGHAAGQFYWLVFFSRKNIIF